MTYDKLFVAVDGIKLSINDNLLTMLWNGINQESLKTRDSDATGLRKPTETTRRMDASMHIMRKTTRLSCVMVVVV